MTTTPKSVILAVVIFLGLVVLAVVVGAIALQLTDNGDLPGSLVTLGGTALGALAGVLASTRTTPELPPGAQLTGGETTLTAAPLVTTPPGVVTVNNAAPVDSAAPVRYPDTLAAPLAPEDHAQ